MWIWQHPEWPQLTYDAKAVLPHLEHCIQQIAPLQAMANSLAQEQRLNWESAVLLDETLATAGIEGESLDRESVRSSIANKLGIGQMSRFNRSADGLVEILLHAIRTNQQALSHQQLKAWHQTMFPTPPLIGTLTIGEYRNGAMQILSGRYGREAVHFVAPGGTHAEVTTEMNGFLDWLNTDNSATGYIRAAIAKLHFVVVHPFDDGNGRLSRIIAERCLAEAEGTDLRLYSLSHEIEKRRGDYYDVLEQCERGQGDITQWIIWFLDVVAEAGLTAHKRFQQLIQRTLFWQQHHTSQFNDRQIKLLKRLLETADFADGISRKKYRALTRTSDASAARDLSDLVAKRVLVPEGEGRGRRYRLDQLPSSS